MNDAYVLMDVVATSEYLVTAVRDLSKLVVIQDEKINKLNSLIRELEVETNARIRELEERAGLLQ